MIAWVNAHLSAGGPLLVIRPNRAFPAEERTRGTKPAYDGDVLGFWKRVYGTPKGPLQLGARLLNVYLAPALPGTELDMVAFQFSEDIKAKAIAGNRYEEIRKQVDPLLDDPTKYWSTIIPLGLKDHYPVVSELLGPRIRQSLL